MEGLWLENQQLSYRSDLPYPQIPGGEALIRVRLAGICATDLELVKGYYPYRGVPGHEFVGEVVAVNDPAGDVFPWTGKRVVGEINAACGSCAACLACRPTHCERRTVLGIIQRDGVFASYFSLPLKNLHIVPDTIPDEQAVFTEPLAAALEILEQVQVRPDDRVLVVGAGRLGQLVAQSLALTGCDLRVLVRHANQRGLLSGRKIAAISADELPMHTMDIVVEATGSPDGFELARQAVRPRGTIVLKSTYHGNIQLNLSAVVVDEITLVGSRCGPFQPALRLLETGQADPGILIDAQYSLAEGIKAFERAAQPGTLKVLIRP